MRFKRFRPHIITKGGWFKFFLRISPRTGAIIWRLEAVVDVTARRSIIRRRVCRLIKWLYQTTPGVGVVSIFFKTPQTPGGGWRFERVIKNPHELNRLLLELKEELRERIASRRISYWEALTSLMMYMRNNRNGDSTDRNSAYSKKEFNRLMNQYHTSLKWKDEVLRRYTAEGRALKKEIERIENRIGALRAQVARRPSSALIRRVDELEEAAGRLRARLRALRQAYKKLAPTTPLIDKKSGGVDWASWLRYRRYWFKRLCNPPGAGGLRLPPADSGGWEDAALLRAAKGLWGEEYQTKGLRLHYLSQFWE